MNVLPARVIVESVVDVIPQTLGELVHERCAGSDAVGVEVLLLGVVLGQRTAASDNLLLYSGDVGSTLLALLRRAESTTSLLIHLCTRSLEKDDSCGGIGRYSREGRKQHGGEKVIRTKEGGRKDRSKDRCKERETERKKGG